MTFLLGQIREVKEGGPAVLWHKAFAFLSICIAILPLLLIRLLRPFIVLRFAELDSSRIGPFAGSPEVYLCERDAGIYGHQGRIIDLFYHQPQICNRQLKRMWDRTLHVFPFIKPLDRLNQVLPGGGLHEVPWRPLSHRDIHGLLDHTEPHIGFSSEEENLAKEGICRLGLPKGAPFVCFHSRDSAYLNAVIPTEDWVRAEHRNSKIQNFLPAVEELTRRGYYTVRMGAIVETPLDTINPMIIDYASKARTELLDIYLSANCAFFICSSSGIEKVPMVFRRPTAYVNYLPVELLPTWSAQDICIPKKLWLRDEGRFLTFREILSSEIKVFVRKQQYDSLGVETIENTPEEISDLVMEMEDRLQGRWETTEDDEELQRLFWSYFKPNDVNGVFRSRVGAQFLRQNRALLD